MNSFWACSENINVYFQTLGIGVMLTIIYVVFILLQVYFNNLFFYESLKIRRVAFNFRFNKKISFFLL